MDVDEVVAAGRERTGRRPARRVGAVLLLAVLVAACSAAPAPRQSTTAGTEPSLHTVLDREFSSARYAGLTSVVVLAGGRTAYAWSADGGAGHHHVWSVTKSVLSLLVGIAIEEGRIPGVDATVAQLLPGQADAMAPGVADLTLEQLLTMRTGLDDEAAPPDGTVATIVRSTPHDTGEFSYGNSGAHLVAAILAEATGSTVLEYARAVLFEPLGIPTRPATEPTFDDWDDLAGQPGFAWYVDANGVHLGALGLSLRAQDLASVGRLLLDEGRWNGRQVVPAAWVRTATTEHVPLQPGVEGFAPPGDVGYGYLWWTCTVDGEAAFSANGSFGQRLVVVPSRDLVVVTQAGFTSARNDWAPGDTAVNEAIESVVAPAFR